MDYQHIIKEIEPHVRYRDENEEVVQRLHCVQVQEYEQGPSNQDSNVAYFIHMIHQKYPVEYVKKLIQWIEYVVGQDWREMVPTELYLLLDGWILVMTEQYRLN
jgi:hypothetical protein